MKDGWYVYILRRDKQQGDMLRQLAGPFPEYKDADEYGPKCVEFVRSKWGAAPGDTYGVMRLAMPVLPIGALNADLWVPPDKLVSTD